MPPRGGRPSIGAGRGDIGIGDAITAMAGLGAGPGASERIAALLGFELRPARSVASSGQGDSRPSFREYVPEIPRPVPRERVLRSSDPDRPAPRLGQSAASPTSWRRYLQPIGRQFSSGGISADRPLPDDPKSKPVLPLQPLLDPRWTARVVEATAATDVGDGDLDVDVVVEAMATRRPIEELPREARLSLLRGAQVLVDLGESMTIFERDCLSLVAAFQATVGRHLVQEVAFMDSPMLGAGPGPAWTWEDYRPPPPTTPVIVLSDLGIPGRDPVRARPQDWLRLHRLLARRGSLMVIFAPFPASRWPAELRGRIRIVQWDRATTTSVASRAVGR